MKTIDNAADATHETTVHILAFPPTVLTSLAFFVLSFFVSWKLALIATAMVPFYLLLVTLYVRWTRRHWWRIQELWRTAMGRAYDASTNILTVKATGQEDAELARMQSLHQQSLSSLASVDFVWALFEGIGYFMILKILLITTGVLLLAHGEINLGQLFFFQFCFFRLVVPFEMLGSIAPRLSEKIAKIRAAEDLLALPISVQNPAHPKRLPALRGGLTLENVSFSYGDGEALKNLSLSIAPGEHLAVVGHSGAGKSTLASLLLRFYDPTSGAILIDGVDLRELDLGWWRQQVGLVLQENMTFHDTVLENIRYVKPGATLVEVQRAAEQAAAATFVAGLPQGYDTIVGERGIRLSGGERQRVAIARAMLQQPTLVVLDEPTSALDSLTERDVHQGLQALTHGRTSITIAHRLSTVQAADRIAVLAHGQLIACAPHAELLRTCDTYRRMVELQQSGLLADDSHQQ
jgi:ABC-type multidrug transport system fused ATPase/permease subunit